MIGYVCTDDPKAYLIHITGPTNYLYGYRSNCAEKDKDGWLFKRMGSFDVSKKIHFGIGYHYKVECEDVYPDIHGSYVRAKKIRIIEQVNKEELNRHNIFMNDEEHDADIHQYLEQGILISGHTKLYVRNNTHAHKRIYHCFGDVEVEATGDCKFYLHDNSSGIFGGNSHVFSESTIRPIYKEKAYGVWSSPRSKFPIYHDSKGDYKICNAERIDL